MRMLFLAAAAAALAAPTMALAGDDAAPPADTKPAKPKKICRESEASSTSRMGSGRVCHTEAEWADIDARGGERRSNGRAVLTGAPSTN